MIQVLEIHGDGTAVVSTEGLRRLVIQPGDDIKDELVPVKDAERYVSDFNECNGDGQFWAEAIDYSNLVS